MAKDDGYEGIAVGFKMCRQKSQDVRDPDLLAGVHCLVERSTEQEKSKFDARTPPRECSCLSAAISAAYG